MKKDAPRQRAKPPGNRRRPRAWQAEFCQRNAGDLIFLDESAAKTDMTRLRGRAPQGLRVYDSAPAGHWSATTMIGSIRLDGATTCMTIEAATDRDIFAVYVERILVPALKPGDIVVMDNLSSHKEERILKLIEQAGCPARFLPAYSPDLNPIEKMWSKIKTFLRSAKARSSRALNNAIAKALKTITPTDAQNWFASCGYSIT